MKLKQAVVGTAMLAGMTTAAYAQSAGSFTISTGWFHLAPQSSSQPLRVTSIGGSPTNIVEANTGATLSSADTIGITAGYFVTDHIAAELVVGYPPSFDLNGTGSLERFGKIGQAKQWSPTLLFKYYFNAPTATFRPYLGIGVSRIWFTDEKITNGTFEANVLHGPTSVTTDSSWEPVFNAGFSYSFNQHWFAGVSVSYLPLNTTAKLNTQARTPVGTLNVQSQTKIKLNPIVTYVNIGYRF